jgi:MoxR-like ATPase
VLAGRPFVIPDDVRALVVPVLGHRLIPAARVELRGRSRAAILTDLVARIPVPVEPDALRDGES